MSETFSATTEPCPTCRGVIDLSANKCPHCGHDLRHSRSSIVALALGGIVVMGLIALLANLAS